MDATVYRERFARAIEHYCGQIAGIRTGRANPALVEDLSVDSYGSRLPLIQLASISAPEARLIIIQPWDPNNVKPIEKAILASPLGLTPALDGQIIRLSIPPLNEERRRDLIKVLGQYSETAKIAIRKVREDCLKEWKESKRQGHLSEDDLTRLEKELQTAVDEQHELITKIASEKEAEILTI